MSVERDKYLTEAMGECWHETMLVADEEGGGAPFHICRKCKIGMYSKANNNFSTWEGFGKLWEWTQKQEWWRNFLLTSKGKIHDLNPLAFATGTSIIDLDRFADAVYSYLKEKP